MPRKPRVRVNYQADAQYLERLAFAVGEDERLTPYQRRQLVEHTIALAREFQGMDGEKTEITKTQEVEKPETPVD